MKNRLYFILGCIFFLLFGSPVYAGAQIINTFAGTGLPAYGGDGDVATLGYLHDPYGICLDTSGNLYIADAGNNRIRKVDASGIISTFAGNGLPGSAGDSGLAAAAALYSPWSVIADKAGNIYFSDAGNYRIRKITAAGIIYTIAGNGIYGYSGNGGPATAAKITSSYGVAVDATGNVYFSDPANNVIRRINTSGIISTTAGTGSAGFSGDGTPATSAQFRGPYGLAIDGAGNLYIADRDNNRIRMINPAGIISTVAGNGTGGYIEDNVAATATELNAPNSVTTDDFGNLYITDQANSRVRKVNELGIITTIAGAGTGGFYGDEGPATAALLNGPSGAAIGRNGNIYIADYDNERIRVIDNVPAFVSGAAQSLSFCGSATQDINSLLSISDADAGQTETWSLVTMPLHGTAVASYSTISTGGILTPVGLSYTPFAGYYGTDAFKVRISDGAVADTTTVNVTTANTLNAGIIIGGNKVCIGATITLTETVTGGAWSSSSAGATVAGGLVTGIAMGVDSIFYTVTNACGPAKAIWPVAVVPAGNCDTSNSSAGIPVAVISAPLELTVYPNPGQGSFTIKLSCAVSTQTHFVITNILGVKVKEFTATANTPTGIKLTAPPGIYFLSATNVYGKWSEKMVVQ